MCPRGREVSDFLLALVLGLRPDPHTARVWGQGGVALLAWDLGR